jgi:transcriptional regulator with XRE-family HTH domain
MDKAPENRIRELRNARGWKLVDLANKLDSSAGQISDLENGKRELTIHWMRRIARALGVEPADLLSARDYSTSLTAEEHLLLERFRNGESGQREQLLRMAEIIVPDVPLRGAA